MLLTLSTTHSPATDLGYLLHKNPARTQTEELSFGQAHVFYPEANDERCLSGGTFQNVYLLSRAVHDLRRHGFEVFLHAAVPANDGGISLGQAMIANERIQREIG